MSEINVNSKMSFMELSKRLHKDGAAMLDIAEVMTETNEMLEDIPWFQCNQILTEKIARRTSLPTGTWRKAYQGVASKASTTQVVEEPVALLEARSEIDEDIIDNAPDKKATRRSEDVAFTQGLAQQLAEAFIAGKIAGNDGCFDGLQQRLNDLDQITVFDGGNAGGTSVYVVDWGRMGAYGIYPAAAANRGPLGLTINTNPSGSANGKEKAFDGNNNPYYVYATQFKWWVGLAVKDELKIGRYCNINPTIGGSNSFSEDKLIELLNRGHFNPATTRIYMNPTRLTQCEIRGKDKANMNWNSIDSALGGKKLTTFRGVIVRRLDAISDSETTVTA
jgi:hypothetical protein